MKTTHCPFCNRDIPLDNSGRMESHTATTITTEHALAFDFECEGSNTFPQDLSTQQPREEVKPPCDTMNLQQAESAHAETLVALSRSSPAQPEVPSSGSAQTPENTTLETWRCSALLYHAELRRLTMGEKVNTQLAFPVEEKIHFLELRLAAMTEELALWKASAGFCESHQPKGGSRHCLDCVIRSLYTSLQRIADACGKDIGEDFGISFDDEGLAEKVAAKFFLRQSCGRLWFLKAHCKASKPDARDCGKMR